MRLPERMKKSLGILLVLLLIVQSVPATVFAVDSATPTESVTDTMVVTAAPEDDLPDNDELFAMYAEQKLYDMEWSTFGTRARDNLNAAEQSIYDSLKTRIEHVAANGGSTVFVFDDVPGLKMQWTNTELGVDSITDISAVGDLFAAQFSSDAVFDALRSDCPFDLYWYNKAVYGGVSMSYRISCSGKVVNGATIITNAYVKNLTFSFKVISGYQDGSETVVTSNVAKVETAKTNAAKIVEKYKGKSAYDRLLGYKNEICNLVSYNDAAASDNYTGGYGDPWQLIYVFDGDSKTKVVCEGYAKAFQYLCDLGGLDCISVTGTMSWYNGSGAHMWNIVTLNGSNYLVDVTNCDGNTIGAPNKLFLVGCASGSAAKGYSFTPKYTTYTYTYDSSTAASWTTEELTLAASNYKAPVGGVTGDLDLDDDVDSDDLTMLARHVGGIELVEGLALANADVNGDGVVNSDDLTKHARYVGGIITSWDQE